MKKKQSDSKTEKTAGSAKVLKTLVELKNHYGVSTRVIRDQWLNCSDFPGKSGKGKKPGRFPLEEINKWLLEREANRKHGSPSKAAAVAAQDMGIELPKPQGSREKMAEVELRLALLKLNRESGEYLDKAKTIQVISKQHTIAVQKLKSLPFKLLSILPPETPPVLKASFFQQAETAIKEACESISSEYMSGVLE